MPLQTLPPTASRYAREQREEFGAALAAVRRLWARRMTSDFDWSWAAVAPRVLQVLDRAQFAVAEGAAAYVPAVLAETGQRVRPPAYEFDVRSIVGTAGDGMPTDTLIYGSLVRVRQAVSAGMTPVQALDAGGKWLSRSVSTLLSDTARTVERAGAHSRSVAGYVRMLNPPSCGRCVTLAGKWTRNSTPFQRHPRCDCRNIPASESVGGDMLVDTDAYLRTLDEDELAKVLGSQANAQAYLDGADPRQLINAYRSGVSSAQVFGRNVTYTTESWTRQGDALRQYRALTGRGPKTPRLMPETIYQQAANRDEAVRLLRMYGWVR